MNVMYVPSFKKVLLSCQKRNDCKIQRVDKIGNCQRRQKGFRKLTSHHFAIETKMHFHFFCCEVWQILVVSLLLKWVLEENLQKSIVHASLQQGVWEYKLQGWMRASVVKVFWAVTHLLSIVNGRVKSFKSVVWDRIGPESSQHH